MASAGSRAGEAAPHAAYSRASARRGVPVSGARPKSSRAWAPASEGPAEICQTILACKASQKAATEKASTSGRLLVEANVRIRHEPHAPHVLPRLVRRLKQQLSTCSAAVES